jgi:hypothetical protein
VGGFAVYGLGIVNNSCIFKINGIILQPSPAVLKDGKKLMKMLKCEIPVTCFLFIFFANASNGQRHYKEHPWKAVIFFEAGKIRGEFERVTDSSIIITGRDKRPDEVPFDVIRKIRLIKDYGQPTRQVIGFFAGGAFGATAGSMLLRGNNRTGEPAALAGVVGGIAGGIIAGITGAISAPGIYNLFSAKRFHVAHDPAFYKILRIKLEPYTPAYRR